MRNLDYSDFVPLQKAMVDKQRLALEQGVTPTLHDALQLQLDNAARGALLDSWFVARHQALPPPAPVPKPAPAPVALTKPKAMTCSLCGGEHNVRDHPKGTPITKHCHQCGFKHARYGPLTTPCGSDAK
jgi:hypothetical protein